MTLRSRNPIALLLLLALLAVSAAPLAAQGESDLATEQDKLLYAVGLALAQQLGAFGITEEELSLVQQGIAAGVLKSQPKVDLSVYGPKLQAFAQERIASQAAMEKAASSSYVEEQAAKEGAERTDSGLVITEMTAGDGASPGADDRVTVHYHGTLRDGSVFDSSVDRGEPATFGLNQVIPCWTEGLQLMKVGGKSRLVCPADIAYGDQGRPGIPGGAALTFEVELLDIGDDTGADASDG